MWNDYKASFYIAKDLLTYENNLNRTDADAQFRKFTKDYKLKYENYETLRKELIDLIKDKPLLQDYWKKRKKLTSKIQDTIEQLNKKLGIKKEKYKVI